AVCALLPIRIWFSKAGSDLVTYQTDIGGLQDVHLKDGSTITLGGLTAISVAFTGRQRSVSLIRGQAWFRVVHNSKWPFVVSAGDGTITDLGTAFLVTRESDRVVVAVTQGSVEISAQPSIWARLRLDEGTLLRPGKARTHLSSGQQLWFDDQGAVSPIRTMDTHSVIAWTQGRLMFDDQPLRYVIETINRYSARHIIVSSEAGRLRL